MKGLGVQIFKLYFTIFVINSMCWFLAASVWQMVLIPPDVVILNGNEGWQNLLKLTALSCILAGIKYE